MPIQPIRDAGSNLGVSASSPGPSASRVTPHHVRNRPADGDTSSSSHVEQRGDGPIPHVPERLGHLSRPAQELMVAATAMIMAKYVDSSALRKQLRDHWLFVDSLRTDSELREHVEQYSEDVCSRTGADAKAHIALAYVLLRIDSSDFSSMTGSRARAHVIMVDRIHDALEKHPLESARIAAFIKAYTSLPGLKDIPLIGQLAGAVEQRGTDIYALKLLNDAVIDLQADPEWNAVLESIGANLPIPAAYVDDNGISEPTLSNTQIFLDRVQEMILEDFKNDSDQARYFVEHQKFVDSVHVNSELREDIELTVAPGQNSIVSMREGCALNYVLFRMLCDIDHYDKGDAAYDLFISLRKAALEALSANPTSIVAAGAIKALTSMPPFTHIPAIGQPRVLADQKKALDVANTIVASMMDALKNKPGWNSRLTQPSEEATQRVRGNSTNAPGGY